MKTLNVSSYVQAPPANQAGVADKSSTHQKETFAKAFQRKVTVIENAISYLGKSIIKGICYVGKSIKDFFIKCFGKTETVSITPTINDLKLHKAAASEAARLALEKYGRTGESRSFLDRDRNEFVVIPPEKADLKRRKLARKLIDEGDKELAKVNNCRPDEYVSKRENRMPDTSKREPFKWTPLDDSPIDFTAL